MVVNRRQNRDSVTGAYSSGPISLAAGIAYFFKD